jgi:iron complex transport system substrate-binding protein
VIGRPGEKSYRTDWATLERLTPEVVVCGPCGYDLEGSTALAHDLVKAGRFEGVPVWAVDANASFARPGPRLVDGIETLAGIFHPDAVAMSTLARRIR